MALILGACASQPPPISHVVLIDLLDEEDTPALLADSERLLRSIPSVRSFAAGRHIETGRASVLADYDVGLVIAFDDPAGYTAYVDHPKHVELVETWGPRLASIRIFDVAQDAESLEREDARP